MNKRDLSILKTLEEFRVLDRDRIRRMFFGDVKDSVSSCNKVLKRLQRDGYILSDQSTKPYTYFPNPSTVKKGSAKIEHFMNIADCHFEAVRLGKVQQRDVEPKLGEKGTVEPDMFMIWNNTPFFVEVQLTKLSLKQFNSKLDRYMKYYVSDKWKLLPWQPKEKKFFPYILLISEKAYPLEQTPFPVFQVKSFSDFHKRYAQKKNTVPN